MQDEYSRTQHITTTRLEVYTRNKVHLTLWKFNRHYWHTLQTEVLSLPRQFFTKKRISSALNFFSLKIGKTKLRLA